MLNFLHHFVTIIAHTKATKYMSEDLWEESKTDPQKQMKLPVLKLMNAIHYDCDSI